MRAEPRLLAGTPPPARPYDADIIILSHHRPRETIAAIRSAAGQGGLDYHVIVLDQDSAPSMRAAMADAVTTFDNVALFGIAENLGVPGGRNCASALGHGHTIVALDNDAVFAKPDTAARAAARLAAAPDLGAIGFRILAADGKTLDLTSWGYSKRLQPRAADHFAATTFVGCGHALTRSCFDGIGGYDASLFFAWEEYEFARRAIAAGWRIEHHGDLAVVHDVSPEARIDWHTGRWRFFVRNRLLIAHDWHGMSGFLTRAAFYLFRGSMAGQPGNTLRAVAEARHLAHARPRREAGIEARRYILANEIAHRLPCGAKLIAAGASVAAMALPRAGFPARSGRS